MLLLEVLCGVVLGFVLGLIPNIHINLIGYVFSLFGVFVFFKENFYFFFSLCVSQTLTSIIPSFIFYTQTPDVLFSPFLGQTPATPSETKALLLLSFLSFLLGGIFSVLFLPFFYLLFLLFSDFYF
jgi:TctA family transporter